MEIILFSAKVQQCNIVFSVVPVQLKVCFTSLKFAITFLVFVLPLGLYFRLVCTSAWFVRMEDNGTPNANNYF